MCERKKPAFLVAASISQGDFAAVAKAGREKINFVRNQVVFVGMEIWQS